MYNIIRIHNMPVVFQAPAVEISTIDSIPEHLRKAISIVNCELLLDNENGIMTAPPCSVICYEKSDKTESGYNCWAIGQLGTNLEKRNGVLCTKPTILYAILIPDKDEPRPLWASSCDLVYNDDGTVTLTVDNAKTSGRVGIDFLLCDGRSSDRKTKVSILATHDKAYPDYIICDNDGNDLGRLCEFYPV